MGSAGFCSDITDELIRELTKGQAFTKQLQALQETRQAGDGPDLDPARDELMAKILRSLELCISLAGAGNRNGKNVLVGQPQASAFSSDCAVTEGSGDSSGTKKRLAAVSDRRGSYKRRKSDQKTWTEVTSTMDDGWAWRKYGQKNILNAKFSRSYFRCTHKYDQQCKASKQVQKMEDNPEMYQTTYIGCHTCNRYPAGPPQFIIPDPSEPEAGDFIVFRDPVKEEARDQVDAKSDITDNVSFTSFDNHSPFFPADQMMGFELSSSGEGDQYNVSRMYQLEAEDGGAQSEIELLLRGSDDFPTGFGHIDENDFS